MDVHEGEPLVITESTHAKFRVTLKARDGDGETKWWSGPAVDSVDATGMAAALSPDYDVVNVEAVSE